MRAVPTRPSLGLRGLSRVAFSPERSLFRVFSARGRSLSSASFHPIQLLRAVRCSGSRRRECDGPRNSQCSIRQHCLSRSQGSTCSVRRRTGGGCIRHDDHQWEHYADRAHTRVSLHLLQCDAIGRHHIRFFYCDGPLPAEDVGARVAPCNLSFSMLLV